MRRGHPGLGGWRSENPRHFRPRNGGTPHFRPPRSYPLLENPRFPPPGPRPHRGPHSYNPHLRLDHGPQEHHGRNKYHFQNNARMQDRGHLQPRQILPFNYHNTRQKTNIDHNSPYKESVNFYNDVEVESCQINSMGDIDHRPKSNQDSYSHNQPISPWANPPPPHDNKKHYNDDRSPHKNYRHHEPEGNKIPVLEYGGHRPPSSDHYGGNPGPMVNNDNSFSRSVDDTVDIVRRRLMNRNESQRSSEESGMAQSSNDQEVSENINQHTQEEPPAKKRIQRQKHNAKANCDKMKSKIVHQLFKMDKDKMHKLMDNPSSSTKFEYAISSLITESQISLNRHLRSVAEKSLYSSSTDFIQNDNNTIYEDTFMKEMQCLLDPQDTVLLEDIKPIVMAELSKVLQLDDLEQRYDGLDDLNAQYPGDDQPNYPYYESYNYEEYPQERYYEQDQVIESNYDNQDNDNEVGEVNNYEYNQTDYNESKPLFERRPAKSIDHNLERRQSRDSQRLRRSLENPADDKFKSPEESMPLFDTNAEQLSEEEDPFAEFDKQYHVAVDHNFIESDDITSIKKETLENINNIDIKQEMKIKKEIDSQIQSIAKSPLKLFPTSSGIEKVQHHDINLARKQMQSPDFAKENNTPSRNARNNDHTLEKVTQNHEHAHVQPKETEKVTIKSENNTTVLKSSPSNTRKRSIDQRPSHRKEKRKKSESSHPVNDEAQCRETPKSMFRLFFPKDDSVKEVIKDNKKVEAADKVYSDKYVKRKDTQRKSKDKESETSKKRSSSSSSHSNVSPKDNNNTTTQTSTKDPKTKLKPIDMFVEQPKKVMVHQAHRNTAPNLAATLKIVDDNKLKATTEPINVAVRKTTSRHVAIQVVKKVQVKATQTFESKCVSNRFSQTEKKKLLSKLVQTDPVTFEKRICKTNDAFERMKEIDLEIQVLLQEKFKLYSSLEAKDSCPSSMPSLGMTVLNVTPYEESKDDNEEECDNLISADAIVDDFTNIPVEELEQIALESVHEENDTTKSSKRSVVQKLQQERKSSESPTSTKRINKKANTPNISLLEQIITDDRPLEDIISLDDLEKPPTKNKRKPPKTQSRKKFVKRAKPVKSAPSSYKLRECSVVLVRADISAYLTQTAQIQELEIPAPKEPSVSALDVVLIEEIQEPESEVEHHDEADEIVEEVVNDLQFDMLDVSEDIVIGDICEIKCSEDKDHERVTISEEIILDNSQSSSEDVLTESGQIENVCKTYDYSTDENLRRDSITVTGHADAVLAIECIENDFIAACLDGNVYHFGGNGQLLNTMRGSNLAVTCLTIVKEKYEITVYTGSLDSRIRYYDLETGLEKGPECNVLSPIQTMDRAWDTIFVGTRTGFVLQFECKNNMLIPVSTVKFSEQSILALRAMKEGPRKVLLVAARSENVTIKDAQTGLLLRTLVGPKMTVYTLLFEDGKVYCGTSSHQIHVFDYASGSHTACHEGGKGAVCLRATGGLVFAGCYDGCVYVFREGQPRPLAQLRGPSLMLLSLAVVGTKIIAGYKDRSLYIWKIPLSILQEMIL